MSITDKDVKEVQLALKCRQYKLSYGSYCHASRFEQLKALPEAQYNMDLQMLLSIFSQCLMLRAIAKAQQSSKLSS